MHFRLTFDDPGWPWPAVNSNSYWISWHFADLGANNG